MDSENRSAGKGVGNYNEPGDGLRVWKDPDDIGTPLYLAVKPLDRIGNRYDGDGAFSPGCGSLSGGVW